MSQPPQELSATRLYQRLTGLSLILLIVLCLGWELWWSPLRPGGSMLALKALPLFFLLSGVLRGRLYTYQWSCMFILLYFIEGATRAVSEGGSNRLLALAECMLALVFFFSSIAFIRARRGQQVAEASTPQTLPR